MRTERGLEKKQKGTSARETKARRERKKKRER